MMKTQTLAVGALAAVLAVTSAQAAGISALKDKIKAVNPLKAFSVDGAKGPFVEQVKNRDFTPPAATTEALGFGAANKGEFQRAVFPMPKTSSQIKALVDRLDAGWPYAKPVEVRILMLGAGNYQAEARADGSITVTFGLLNQAETDDEVAFILGHELAHLRLNHFARDSQVSQWRRLATQANAIYSDVVRVSQIRSRDIGENVQFYTADEKKVAAANARAAANKDTMDLLLGVLMEAPWKRGQEDEADAVGYDLASKAGYAPSVAAPTSFQRLEVDFNLRQSLSEVAQAQMKESLAVVAMDAATVIDAKGGSSGIPADAQKSALTNSLRTEALDLAVKFFQRRHRSPDARKAGLGAYSAAAYPDSMDPPPRTTWLAQVRNTPEFKDAKIAVQAVQLSMKGRSDGNPQAAIAAIAPALKTSYRDIPLVANEAARAYDDGGNFAVAEKLFTAAHKSPYQTLDGYKDHLDMLLRTRRFHVLNRWPWRGRPASASGHSCRTLSRSR